VIAEWVWLVVVIVLGVGLISELHNLVEVLKNNREGPK
jgi:hypothetical protein